MKSKNLQVLDRLESKLHLSVWRIAVATLPTVTTFFGALGVMLPVLAIAADIHTPNGVSLDRYFLIAGSGFLFLCVTLFSAQSRIVRRNVSDRWLAQVVKCGDDLHSDAVRRLSAIILESGTGKVSIDRAVKWINDERARDPSFRDNLPAGARLVIERGAKLGGQRL